MAWFNRVVSFILLITIPLFSTRPAISAEAIPGTTANTIPMFDFTQGTRVMTYDQLLDLINALEEGELDDLEDTEEIESLLRFVTFITEKGAHFLSDESLEEVKRDTQALLSDRDNDALDSVDFAVLHNSGGYSVIPAVYMGSREVVVCKSWADKRIHHIKKYVKKHKKAFIIGGAVVVAAVAVVCVAAAVASAGAAALGEAGAAAASGLAASAADKDNHREDEEDWSIGSQQEGSNTSSLSPSQKEQSSSTLSMAVENQLEAIQEANANQPIFNRSETSGSFVDNVRETAAYIAHDALNDAAGIGALVPSIQEEIQGVASHFSRNEAFLNEASPVQGYENLVVDAHEFIDQVFSTDQAELYSSGAKGVKDNFAVGMIPLPGSFEVTKFTEAGKVLDRAGFTKAGRALMKHGYREGSSFPKPTGNITQVNEHGQKVLESIINHPEKKIIYGNTTRHGHIIDIYAPDIGGVRYTSEGEFITFLEP